MSLLDLYSDDADLLGFMREIGWFPGRRADLQGDRDVWSARGYSASEAALEFMEECNGLQFDYPRHPAVGGSYECLVSGASSAQQVARSLVAEYEERLGCELCPVGQSASGNLILFMAPDGTTYGGRDGFLAKVSDDGYHALQAIRNRVDLTPISHCSVRVGPVRPTGPRRYDG